MRAKLKVGDIVEWHSISKKRKAAILKIKPNGDLILDSRKLGLCKNVCIKSHRVTKL